MALIKSGKKVHVTIDNCNFYGKDDAITLAFDSENIPKKEVLIEWLDILPQGTIDMLRAKVLLQTGFDIYDEIGGHFKAR